ncbi:MAG: hypothetical protein ACXWMV_03170 [Syntrophales bacterium]
MDRGNLILSSVLKDDEMICKKKQITPTKEKGDAFLNLVSSILPLCATLQSIIIIAENEKGTAI